MHFDFDLLKTQELYDNHIFIIYDPTFGYSCPDGLFEGYVTNLAENFEAYAKAKAPIFIGSELLIMAIRVAICQGLIPFDRVAFFYDRFAMHPDKWGRLDSYPQGFCDHLDDYLAALLSDSWFKKEEKKNE